MRRYSVSGGQTSAASKTSVAIYSTAALRPFIYDVISSFTGTPADNSAEYQAKRCTTTGTSTAFTPLALDPGDPAATGTAGVAHTTEPTYTASSQLLDWDQNVRATFRWIAAPDSELYLPASTNGIGFQCIGIGGSGQANVLTALYRE
jgi:hypothetical protein